MYKNLHAQIFNYEQQNPFYDERRSSNGGGYDQPSFDYVIVDNRNRIIASGSVDDTSCGDFGARVYITFTPMGGETLSAYWNTVDGHGYDCDSDFSRENPDHVEYMKIIRNLLRYGVWTKEDAR